jgi:UDP:flavonoid glycosyltransferase YjiC (YdhE family)
MKIGIQTWGSNGDIRPYIALADGLKKAGHEVTLVYTSPDNKNYDNLTIPLGIRSFSVYDKFEMNLEVIAKIIESGNLYKQWRILFHTYYEPALAEMISASEKLCKENDIVIGHYLAPTLAFAAEALNTPRVIVHLLPNAVESKYISPAGINFGLLMNKVLWKFVSKVSSEKIFRFANDIKKNYGLPPIKDFNKEYSISKDLTIIAVSPELAPPPKDWNDHIQFCGFLNLPQESESWRFPSELKIFLEGGPSPVFLTFGSFMAYKTEDNIKIFKEAVKKTGQRAIIQADWETITDDFNDPMIYKIGKCSHNDILPHCSAVVHHGGVGTTQASLLAGCPSIVVEHAFDQYYWGKRLQKMGVSPGTLHRRSLTSNKLARLILKAINNKNMKQKSMEAGKRMKFENGVQNAVTAIESRLCR